MGDSIETRLNDMGLALPAAAAPAANYRPWLQVGQNLHVSGQLSAGPDGLITGRLGGDLDIAAGQDAARASALALLAQIKEACGGDLDRLAQVIRLTVFVNSTPDFTDQPKVANGASDLFGALLGEAGQHVRAAVGVASLPLGAAVEIDGLFGIR